MSIKELHLLTADSYSTCWTLSRTSPTHLMGPILVSKFVAMYTHRPTEARMPPTPTLTPRLYISGRKEVIFFSCKPQNSKNGGTGATKDAEPEKNGSREGENRPSQARLFEKSPCCWKQRPHLLLSLRRGGGNPINEQQRHRHDCRATPKPPTPCHVLSSPSQKWNFPGAGSEGWAWEQAYQPLGPPHWSNSALPGDPPHYVTALYCETPAKRWLTFNLSRLPNRKRIIWRFFIGPLRMMARRFHLR